MLRTAQLNEQAIGLICRGNCDGAMQTLGSALSEITSKVTALAPDSPKKLDEETPRSSTFRVKASYLYMGVESLKSIISYFERPYQIESYPRNENGSLTAEQAAYFSSVCFYNMGLAMLVRYKKENSPNCESLMHAHDCFIRTYDVLSLCKLEPSDSKLLLMLATCNNLAAIQGDLGNIPLLQYWGVKFQVILEFADPQSHWHDANYHLFRLKTLLSAFSFNSAAAA